MHRRLSSPDHHPGYVLDMLTQRGPRTLADGRSTFIEAIRSGILEPAD